MTNWSVILIFICMYSLQTALSGECWGKAGGGLLPLEPMTHKAFVFRPTLKYRDVEINIKLMSSSDKR